jgi:hypothetical protein
MFRSVSIFVTGVCLLSVSVRAAAPEQPKAAVMCGPNSVYILLRLYHLDFEQADLLGKLHTNGMSLQEVADACCIHGLPAEVRMCSMEEVCENLKGPAIVYVKPWTGSGAHYAVILSIDDREGVIHMMDSTTGRYFRSNRVKLGAFYQGFIIVPKNRGVDNGMWSFFLYVSALLWLLLTGIFAWLLLRRPRKSVRTSTDSAYQP